MDISISKVELPISIIVPVYNVEKYLPTCVDSILCQTFTNFELILVDDGSTDRSGIICDEYEKKDTRVKVIHKENGGLSSARNAGLYIAKGKYIGFVDSDDFIDKEMYKVLYNEAEKNIADLVICDFKKVNENYKIKKDSVFQEKNIEILKSDYILDNMYGNMYGKYIVSWNKLYNKNLFYKIKFPTGKINEDEFIAHRLLKLANKIIYINSKLYYYMQRSNSIMSAGFNEKRFDIFYAYKDRINFAKEINSKKLKEDTEYFFIAKFFEYYFKAKHMLGFKRKKLWNLKKIFFSSLNGFIVNSRYNWKEKITWILFLINDNLYENIINKKVGKMNGRILSGTNNNNIK